MTAQTAHWSATYVGLPWLDRGRDQTGCDCWGLARLVYAVELGIELPTYVGDYPSAGEAAEIDRLIRDALDGGPWIEVSAAGEFDLVLFRLGRWDSHIGIMVDGKRMLHMMGRDAAKVERIDGAVWARRQCGVWRHHSRFEAGSKDRFSVCHTPV